MPGLFDAYRAGKIMLANAPGSGIADDKAIYAYMPKIIEFYMGEIPKLENVTTWLCSEEEQLNYVLEHLQELVVKEVHGSGGYGRMIGPAASKRELDKFRRKLKASPSSYIAQPTLSLSTVSVLTHSGGSASCRSSAFRLALTAWNTNYTRRFNPSCNEEKMFGSKLKSGWRN